MPTSRDSARTAPHPWRLQPQSSQTSGSRSAPALLIGMVHLDALPGAPTSRRTIRQISTAAAAEAALLARSGFDGLLLENMHDAPYVMGDASGPGNPASAPHITAAMTAAGLAVQEAVEPFRRVGRPLPMGVQVLAGANRAALAVALACEGAFIRAEAFVFSHVADEGLMPTAQAGPLLRYRREIGADHVAIWADLKKKHAAHALTADVPLADTCHAAEFFRADAVIITGRATGDPTSPDDLAEARAATSLPVVVGSGVTAASVAELSHLADALIVGSNIKHRGDWRQPIDPRRAAALVKAARRG